jgi:hypothetical protein
VTPAVPRRGAVESTDVEWRQASFFKCQVSPIQGIPTLFSRCEAFQRFSGSKQRGKSTILTAFRILAAAIRKANARSAERVRGPHGAVFGFDVDLSSISVGEENIFHDYDQSEPAEIEFKLSNQNSLTLYFPEAGACCLLPDAQGRQFWKPRDFRKEFNCPISFVPILGPLEHHEPLFDKEAARLALFNYRAARNFRNIWYHYPEKFELFRELLAKTWPGMDVLTPEIDHTHDKARLYMYCTEKRIARELFWSGFGFQVWCQMLTHLVQSDDASLFLIDEPDIYLHSDLQRQLIGLLKNLGPDILIATHSTEIIVESDANDIIVINKSRSQGKRIRDTAQLGHVFADLGSNINSILTQLAKTRRAVFVEGLDFSIISKFARRLGIDAVANKRDFAVIQVEGFNPERIRALKDGMEVTLGTKIATAAILDRDYRSDGECEQVKVGAERFCDVVLIHAVKEIENFLLIPAAIERAVVRKSQERQRRSDEDSKVIGGVDKLILAYCESRKSYVTTQTMFVRRQFEKRKDPSAHDSKIDELALDEFEKRWADPSSRIGSVSGKDCLSSVNSSLQNDYNLSITPTAIIDSMHLTEIPDEVKELVSALAQFSTLSS